MKILEPNAGVLTNFEVLDFLRERGAAKDPTRIISRVAPSEYKVYDYLVASPAGSQTIEEIKKFEEESKRFKLAKAEVLNIINNRPSLLVDVEPLVEQLDDRFEVEQIGELVELVKQMFPPLQTSTKNEQGTDLDKKGDDDQGDEHEKKEKEEDGEDEDQEEEEEEEEEIDDELNTVDEENASVEP